MSTTSDQPVRYASLVANTISTVTPALSYVPREVQYGDGGIHAMRLEVNQALGAGSDIIKRMATSDLSLKADNLHTMPLQPL